MSFTNAQQAKYLLGGVDLTAKLTSVTAGTSTEMLDVTTLGDAAKRFIAGLESGELSVEGWISSTESENVFTAIALAEALGLSIAHTYGPSGLAVGAPVILASGKRTNYEIGTPVGGVANFTMNTTGDGYVAPGVSLHALTAETGTVNGTTFDRGADVTSSALGAVAHIHTTAFSGLTSNTVTIEDSANGSAWSTIGTFTAHTASGSSQRLDISGTVRRYLRCVATIVGTGSTTFTVGIAPH